MYNSGEVHTLDASDPTDSQRPTIHIIDEDVSRRAYLSTLIYKMGLPAELYSDIDEFFSFSPKGGYVLIFDRGGPEDVEKLIAGSARLSRDIPVIAFAPSPEPTRVVDMVSSGAVDYLAWPVEEATLNASLERISRRSAFHGSLIARISVAREKLARLSPRQRRVLDEFTDGRSNREIAEALSISPRTVEVHRAALIARLGVSNSSAAIKLAVEATLLAA